MTGTFLNLSKALHQRSVFGDFASITPESKVQEVANKTTVLKCVIIHLMLLYHLVQIFYKMMHFGINLINTLHWETRFASLFGRYTCTVSLGRTGS